MPYATYNVRLPPYVYALPADVTYLSELFTSQNVAPSFLLSIHRRRNAWGSTLPVGTFINDFRENACTWEEHVVARDAVFNVAKQNAFHRRRPFRPAFDPLEFDGKLYNHPEALRVYADNVERPAFLRALYRFLEAANANPSLVVPPASRRPFVPHELRKMYHQLKTPGCRGPAWTLVEDLVLRRWFGMRTVGPLAGHHVRLSDAEWERVLADLPMRNKDAVRNRLVLLNEPLKREFFRDGFVPRDRIKDYMSRVLGERPNIPLRPSLKSARCRRR